MKRLKDSLTLWRMLTVFLVGALLVSPAAASKGGEKGGPNRGTGSEVCWVTPNPVSNGSQFVVSGQGFTPGMTLDIYIGDGGWDFAGVLGDGTFSCTDRAAFAATGQKQVKVYEMGDRHMTVLATCYYTVN
jgi:hypothetical protein